METKKKSLAELKAKARIALTMPNCVWIVRNWATPTAVAQMVRMATGDEKMERASRFAAIIRRDCGEEAFEQAVREANAREIGFDLTSEDGIMAFGCLCEAYKREIWAEWLKTAEIKDIMECLRQLESFHRDDYREGGYQPYEDGAVAELKGRRPDEHQCLGAITNGSRFADAAWELLREEYEIDGSRWEEILDHIIGGQDTPSWIVDGARRERTEFRREVSGADDCE